MKSQMYPDDLFATGAKKIYEPPHIFERTVFFCKFSHALRGNFSIRMEKFIDKIDEDKGSFHNVSMGYI